MLNLIKQKIAKSALSVGVLSIILTSCGGEEVKHSNYLPSNSCVVMSLNTEEIFSDAFFDLIANNDLTSDFATGPLSEMFKDPANAGIKRLTKYHFFAAGSNLLEGKLGAILPLNDKEKLAAYIEKNFPETEVFEDGELLVAEISGEHTVVWNDNTAIYVFSAFGGDQVAAAKQMFKNTDEQSLEKADSTFNYALNNDAHVSVWVKNDDFADFIDQGLNMLQGVKIFDKLNVNKEDIKGAKSVFLANFNDGNITVQQRQYLNPVQMSIYNGFEKENNITNLTKIVSNPDPMLMLSASLNSNGLQSLLEEYQIDDLWKEYTKNSLLGAVQLKQLSQYFEGDVLMMLNGIAIEKQTIVSADIDDEGNDIEVSQEVEMPTPQMAIGLSMKDAAKFKLTIGMLAAALPKYEGYSNYNNKFYFKVADDIMYVTASKSGVDALNTAKGELKPELKSLITSYRTSAYVNFSAIVNEAPKLGVPVMGGVDNLNSLLVSERGVKGQGVIEGETIIKFNSNENGLISTVKLLNGLGQILVPLMTTFHI